MRLLQRLRHDVAGGEAPVLPVVLDFVLRPELREQAHGLLPHRARVLGRDIEPTELAVRRPATGPELQAAVAQQVEDGRALGDPDGVIHREQHDAVADADGAGLPRDRGEEQLRGRGLGAACLEVVLHLPDVAEAVALSELALLERLVVAALDRRRVVRRAREQLVEHAEFHRNAPLL